MKVPGKLEKRSRRRFLKHMTIGDTNYSFLVGAGSSLFVLGFKACDTTNRYVDMLPSVLDSTGLVNVST